MTTINWLRKRYANRYANPYRLGHSPTREGIPGMALQMEGGKWVEKQINRGGRPTEYPYQEWLSNGPVKLKYGVDFDVQPKSMRTTIMQYADRNGIGLESCWVNGDEVCVIPTTDALRVVRDRVARRSV